MTYLFIDFLILIYAALFRKIRVVIKYIKSNKGELFFFFSTLTLVLFSAFRGGFTSDYSNYVLLYDTFKDSSLIDIINRSITLYPEKGYLIFQYFITNIFHNPLYIFIMTSIVIVAAHINYIKKYIDEYVLATILFVSIGGYFSSFNLVRQFMAVSVLLCGSKYLYDRKFWKYLIFIFIATMLHKSSLIMLPFFFLANIRVGQKGIIIYPIALVTISLVTPYAIRFIQRFYWGWYFTNEGVMGYSWKNIVGPLLLALPSLFIALLDRRKQTNTSNGRDLLIENVGLNATFFYAAFNIIGLQVAMAQRFASFFSMYAVGLFCKKIYSTKQKRILIVVFVILFILYQYVTRRKIPYYFVWNNG